MPPLYALKRCLTAGIEPPVKHPHSPPPQAAGQPERFSLILAVEAETPETAADLTPLLQDLSFVRRPAQGLHPSLVLTPRLLAQAARRLDMPLRMG